MEHLYPTFAEKFSQVRSLLEDALAFDDEVLSYRSSMIRFYRLPITILEEIVELTGREIVDDNQNYSPSIREILEDYLKVPDVLVSGYLIDPERSDCRLTIDAILIPEEEPLNKEYRSTCDEYAEDEFVDGRLYRYYWWD